MKLINTHPPTGHNPSKAIDQINSDKKHTCLYPRTVCLSCTAWGARM